MLRTYNKSGLTVFMTSIGDHPVVFDVLARIKTFLPPHQLAIWNNGGPEEHGRKLKEIADIYIDSSHNFGTSKSFGWAFLYLEYDWILIAAIDVLIHLDWWKMIEPFMADPKVGVIGDAMIPSWKTGDWAYVQNEHQFVDGFHLYRREVIERIGSVSPAFGVWGHDLLDLQHRAFDAGWKIVRLASGLQHYGDGRTGTDWVRKQIGSAVFEKMHSRSCVALNQKRANWWEGLHAAAN